MTEPSATWLEAGYADIVAARTNGDDLSITVEFANGDSTTVAVAQFGIPAGPFTLAFDPDEGLSVDVTPTDGRTRTLSWSQIRSATDERFAQELRRRDEDEARRIGARLRALREDRNVSQRDLAQQLSMTGAQLSKIETGTYDLRTSTVQGLLRVLGADYSDISGPDAPEMSQKSMRKIAERSGVPRDLFTTLAAATPRHSLLRLLERAFSWTPDELTSGAPSTRPPLIGVAFKSLGRTDPSQSPLVNLAITVSRVALAGTQLPDYVPLPVDPDELRRRVLPGTGTDDGNDLNLSTLIDAAWQAGVAVLPFDARGGFTAATWTIGTTPVIVLKETRSFTAYWMFDLAHEIGHIALGHAAHGGVVDVESPTARRQPNDAQEQAADQYALDLLMPNHEQTLAEVRAQTRGNYLRFKNAVADVAARHHLSVGLLGMIAAYELTEIGQDKDRWGSATNLARDEGDGRPAVTAAARAHLSSGPLDPIDATLLDALVFVDG